MGSIFKKDTVIDTCPAFDFVKRQPDSYGVINVTANEVFTDKNKLGGWYFGSVVSYALSNNENPIERYNRAVANGHAVKWINACPSVLSADYRPEKEKRLVIEAGDVVRFEGELFTIADAPNRNKKLVPYVKEV